MKNLRKKTAAAAILIGAVYVVSLIQLYRTEKLYSGNLKENCICFCFILLSLFVCLIFRRPVIALPVSFALGAVASVMYLPAFFLFGGICCFSEILYCREGRKTDLTTGQIFIALGLIGDIAVLIRFSATTGRIDFLQREIRFRFLFILCVLLDLYFVYKTVRCFMSERKLCAAYSGKHKKNDRLSEEKSMIYLTGCLTLSAVLLYSLFFAGYYYLKLVLLNWLMTIAADQYVIRYFK